MKNSYNSKRFVRHDSFFICYCGSFLLLFPPGVVTLSLSVPCQIGPANIPSEPRRLHVTVELWSGESFPSSDSQRGASHCFYQPCLCSFGFQLVWFQGMPWINMVFLLLFRHLSVVHSGSVGSVCPRRRIQRRADHLDWVGNLRVGNGISSSGNVSPLLPPSPSLLLSAPHSFFTPLEVVLLTWVNKSFIVSHVYSPFVSVLAAMLHSRGKATYLQRGNTGKRAFCYWSERAASSLTIGSILIGDKQPLYTFTDTCISTCISYFQGEIGVVCVQFGFVLDNKAHTHTHTKQQFPFSLRAFPLDWNSCGYNKVHFFSFFYRFPFVKLSAWRECHVVFFVWHSWPGQRSPSLQGWGAPHPPGSMQVAPSCTWRGAMSLFWPANELPLDKAGGSYSGDYLHGISLWPCECGSAKHWQAWLNGLQPQARRDRSADRGLKEHRGLFSLNFRPRLYGLTLPAFVFSV